MSEQTDETTEIEAEGGEEVEPAAAYDDATLARRRAALAQIVQYGDPVLKSRASEVTEFDEALAEEIQRMIVLMREGLGVGLAAVIESRGHAHAVVGVAGDGGVDDALIPEHLAVDEREIDLFHLAAGELFDGPHHARSH